jgi:hypothetical protein
MGPKSDQIQKRKTAEVFETGTKSMSLQMPGVMEVKDSKADTGSAEKKYASYSTVPRAASEKNGGILGFFKKNKGINDRHDPDNNPQAAVNAPVQEPEVVEGKIRRATIDLTEEERDGSSVKEMRNNKTFLVNRVNADLARERKTPLSEFTLKLLQNLKKLGETDASRFSDEVKRKNTFTKEERTARKCIPFLLEFLRDIDKLESDPNDQDFKTAYEQKYGNISKEERNIIRIYAEVFRDYGGNLQVAAADKVLVTDADIEAPKATNLHNPPREGHFDQVSEVKYADWKKIPLFSHAPTIYDMKQGDIGDCYLVSSLISIVSTDPKIIQNSMVDNGDTVTVRFFRKKRPVYVTVEKTLPYRELTAERNGQKHVSEQFYGAKGALWVSIMEKAYAVFLGNSYNKLESQGVDGNVKFIRSLTGLRAESNAMAGDVGNTSSAIPQPEKYEISSLLEKMRKTEREAFEADLRSKGQLPFWKKQRDVLWNKKKAEIFFGIKPEEYDEKNLSEMFRKNSAFTTWMRKIQEKIRNFTDNGVRSATEFFMVLKSMKEQDFPALNIPGLDEKKLRERYLTKLKDYILNKSPLFNIGDDYEYEDRELIIFENIKDAKANKQIVTTGTSRLWFTAKKEARFEKGQAGVFGNHAYGVLGTTEKNLTVRGKNIRRKFVIVSNPWQHGSRLYDHNGVGFSQEAVEDGAGAPIYDNHGIFLVELRDFYRTFSTVEYQ